MPFRYENLDNGLFHVYNRGNQKDIIFHSPQDYGFFIRQMNIYHIKYNITIYYYCLMPNHFHIGLSILSGHDLIHFMKQVQMTYALYLQRSYKWVGHVFQGRYKTRRVKDVHQFIYLSSYIHLNPFMADIVHGFVDWRWSSYLDYIGLRNGTLVQKDMLMQNFISPRHYREWVETVGKEKMTDKLCGLMIE
ncbi:MAG: transposase [Candidatus Magasanikbacteria bacterium]